MTFFFFQAEDGIRDSSVTGVQTCALSDLRQAAGGILNTRSCSLAMKNKRQACAALRPVTFNAAMIRRKPSFIGSAYGSHIEMKRRVFQAKRGHFNSVDPLVQAIDGGFERTVFRLRNMQNEMEYRFDRFKRTGPVAFQRGGSPLRLWFVNGRSLGRGRRKNGGAEKLNGPV